MNNTTKNSDLFINAYNQIDAFLRKEGEFDSDASFTYKVKSSKNSAVKKFKDDLINLIYNILISLSYLFQLFL